MAGWGAVITLVAREGFARREPWAWWAITLGAALWFVLDTGISAAHGVGFNVAVNVVVLILVAVPLTATRSMAGVGRWRDRWRGGRYAAHRDGAE